MNIVIASGPTPASDVLREVNRLTKEIRASNRMLLHVVQTGLPNSVDGHCEMLRNHISNSYALLGMALKEVQWVAQCQIDLRSAQQQLTEQTQ